MVLSAAGLPPASFASLTPGVTTISAADIAGVRSALVNAYYGIGLPIPSLGAIVAGTTTVEAGHFQELRNLVK